MVAVNTVTAERRARTLFAASSLMIEDITAQGNFSRL